MSVKVGAGERTDTRTSGVLSAAVGAALLYSVFVRFPLLGLIAMLSPLPLIVQRLRAGLGSGLLTTALATSMVSLALSPGQALWFLLVLACPGLLIAQAMARGRGLVRGCGWAFGLLAVEIAALLVFEGREMAAIAARSAVEAFRTGALSSESAEAAAEQARVVSGVIEVVYPAAFVIWGALVVLANAALLRAYLAQRDPGWLEGGEFESIRWPLGLAVVFVLGGAAVAAPPLRSAGYNVLLVVAFFYALQGLAVVSYYAHRLAGPLFVRVALVLLVLLVGPPALILGLLGLFDTWFDFRRWADPPEAEEE